MSEYFDAEKLKFEISVLAPSGQQIKINPLAQVNINQDNLQKEVVDLPAQYAFFTSAYIVAKKKSSMLELELKRTVNMFSKITRKESKASGKKELNNKEVDEIVSDLDVVKKLENELLDASIERDRLYFVCNAIDKKANSIRNLLYLQKQELDATFSARKSEYLNKDAINESAGINPNRFNDEE